LLEEHATRIWRFALRLTGDLHHAEDLTQETLLRAWRHRRRLRDPRKARVWLFAITANLWRDQCRRAKCRPRQADVPVETERDQNVSPEQQMIGREDVKRALDAMDRLPARQREVLYLHTCESLSLAEVASVLKISPGAAKASLSLARKWMRQELEDLSPDQLTKG
jgi:RNA polymerase sigma-70 factor, ECF subfamily